MFDQISYHEINMKYTAIEQILLHTPPLLFIQSLPLPLSFSYLAELYLLFLLYGPVTDIGSTFGRHLLLLAKTHRHKYREREKSGHGCFGIWTGRALSAILGV